MTNHILLNGALRDLEELSLLLSFIVKKIDENPSNRIASVIVSTWKEDAQRNQDFVRWAEDLGVTFVLSESVNEGGPGNFIRQMITLDAGLEHVGPEDIVLKSRTDKSLQRKDVIGSFISSSSNSKLRTALASKVAIEHISTTVPFMAKDMILIGRATAIKEYVSFSLRAKFQANYIFSGMGPEVFLWLEYVRSNNRLFKLLREFDLRWASTNFCEAIESGRFGEELNQHPAVVELFKLWFDLFERRFTFISETLGTASVPSWIIDEGSWKYQIGDRQEFEHVRRLVSQIPVSNTKAPISRKSRFVAPNSNPFTDLSPSEAHEAIGTVSVDYSDIVVIRRRVINRGISESSLPSADAVFRNALIRNLKHRDPEAIQLVCNWIESGDANIKNLDRLDLIFALERAMDLAVLRGDWGRRANLVRLARRFRLVSNSLILNMAEDFYSSRKPLRALVFFLRAFKGEPESLGANHGLGSVLLDLRLNRLAFRFLEKASRMAPQDETAAWTLFRCSVRLKDVYRAQLLLDSIPARNRVYAQELIDRLGSR